MQLLVDRKWKKEAYTISNLYIDGVWFSNVIEDKDRGLTKTMPLSVIKARKVKGETAIPSGTYAVTMRVKSPKFSAWNYKKSYGFCDGYVPRLLGVPGFDGILIHIGNTAANSEGCLCVGINDRKGMVTKSTETFRKLWYKLKEADDRGESISITIK
ncbi:MAG: hypothetical protein IKW99_03460 [Bacteroidales bacterium]|nr:hypothetical protein [Bacteroidales bacterium]